MAARVLDDEAIQKAVMEELEWDPEVEVTDVGVAVDQGVVTLTGTVDSFLKKWAAERAALRVEGVRAVVNHIEVVPRGLGIRTDEDIARAVVTALEENPSVPADKIKVRVEEGRVTLEGEVDWHYQRREAEESARRVSGVKSVINLITVKQPTVAPDTIKRQIEQAFVRHAELDAKSIQVRVEEGGHVVLTGTVRSWAERKEAEEAAWRAPGVTKVTNLIRVQVP
ncbi:BON domain-containing protein [Thermorudis peleae]|uniref:BON domain-containing protein n=1 Tax=Thermorudis peleae TaxID=1382356 RepID=UPI0005716A72|nr:BON domain-containing protein [Thermorudis peleae]